MASSVKRKAVTKLYNGSEAAKHKVLPAWGRFKKAKAPREAALLNNDTSLGDNIPRLDIYVDISILNKYGAGIGKMPL